jgi:hypothetical protein
MEQPDVLPVVDAPNWAATRFGLAEDKLELRILRGPLGCEHIGVSYMRFGPEWPLTVGHRHPPGGEEVYVLIEGKARIKIDDEIVQMDAPAAIRVPSERFRAIRWRQTRSLRCGWLPDRGSGRDRARFRLLA